MVISSIHTYSCKYSFVQRSPCTDSHLSVKTKSSHNCFTHYRIKVEAVAFVEQSTRYPRRFFTNMKVIIDFLASFLRKIYQRATSYTHTQKWVHPSKSQNFCYNLLIRCQIKIIIILQCFTGKLQFPEAWKFLIALWFYQQKQEVWACNICFAVLIVNVWFASELRTGKRCRERF